MALTRPGVSRLALLLSLPVLLLVANAVWAADEIPSFKKRGDEEKQFMAQVGTAVIGAAHPTGKKVGLIKYEINPEKGKEGRAELLLKMEFYGVLTNKKYVADITIKVDVSNKDAWEVLNIDYTDNDPIPADLKAVQALIRKFNS